MWFILKTGHTKNRPEPSGTVRNRLEQSGYRREPSGRRYEPSGYRPDSGHRL